MSTASEVPLCKLEAKQLAVSYGARTVRAGGRERATPRGSYMVLTFCWLFSKTHFICEPPSRLVCSAGQSSEMDKRLKMGKRRAVSSTGDSEPLLPVLLW